MQDETVLDIKLLGRTYAVTRDGSVVDRMGGAKCRQVLSILAVSPGTVVSKDRLVTLLWGEAPPRSARGTLESYVCVLRRSLGETGSDSAIRTTSLGYVLDPTRSTTDVDAVRHLLAVVHAAARSGAPDQAVTAMEAAMGQITGELLETEVDTPWADEARHVFSGRVAAACLEAAATAYSAGLAGAAVRISRLAIEHDRLAEPAWRTLILALGAQGRHAEALAAYGELRELLVDELGIEPSPATRDVYLDLLAAQPAAAGGEHVELNAIMRLLRQALESLPDVVVPDSDSQLSRVAVGWLARTA